MTSDRATRLAALAGREFLPAARELRIVMQAAESRRRLVTRPIWTIRPRTRLRFERHGALVFILAAIAAVLFLGA